MKTNKIIIKDKYGDSCIKESYGDKICGEGRKPEGFVEIYEVDKNGNQQLIGKSNLVVYVGRELLAQKLLRINNPSVDTQWEEGLYWLGVGSGGCAPSDPFNPNPPVSTDTGLYTDVPISDTNPVCADERNGYFYKKPIEAFEFQQDPYNDNSWLIIQTVSRISVSECLGEYISEAGLFTSLENTPGYAGPFHLFSRVTFPTIAKTDTRQLLFIWYIYT